VAFTVASGSLFRARGTLAGPLIVNGTIAPGASVGTLNAGAETWNGGGSYEFEINDATGTAGVDPGWDLLNSSDVLTIGATSGNRFTIQIVSLAGSSAGPAAHFDNAQSYSWPIAVAAGGVSGFAADKFTLDGAGFQNSLGTVGAFSLSEAAGTVYLNFTPVFASAASHGRAWGTAQRLSTSQLLADHTTGNVARELVSVAAGSRGTQPVVAGGLIQLAPLHNFSETFPYVVRLTGHPTSLATNDLTLVVTNAVGSVRSITSSGGMVTLSFAGVPGYKYAVERASEVTGPWTQVQAVTAPSAGVWTFSETPPGSPTYYRSRQDNP
jgi:hypothetical protein